jgi:hypothetical protein
MHPLRLEWFPLVASLACSSSPPKSAEAAREPVQTGRDCAIASARCESGRCNVEVENRCKTPVTCRLRVESLCRTSGGETGPANASTHQVTQLAGTSNRLEAETSCGEGTPVTTKVEAVECI